MPFAEIELPALRTPSVIVPGAHTAYAASAARRLRECLGDAVYRDVPMGRQAQDWVCEWVAGSQASHTNETHTGVAAG